MELEDLVVYRLAMEIGEEVFIEEKSHFHLLSKPDKLGNGTIATFNRSDKNQ